MLTESDDFFVGVAWQSAVAALVDDVAVNEFLLGQIHQLSFTNRPLAFDVA